jgi:hypothetical protein
MKFTIYFRRLGASEALKSLVALGDYSPLI